MPYKWQTKKIKLPKEKDRRIKIRKEDYPKIIELRKSGVFFRDIAKIYGVTHGLIMYICKPETLERNKKLRKDRGGWQQYYDKEYHRKAMVKHRRYKQRVMGEKD